MAVGRVAGARVRAARVAAARVAVGRVAGAREVAPALLALSAPAPRVAERLAAWEGVGWACKTGSRLIPDGRHQLQALRIPAACCLPPPVGSWNRIRAS